MSLNLPGIKISPAALPVIEAVAAKVDSSETAKFIEALQKAAQQDGNRVLSLAEVEVFKKAFEDKPEGIKGEALTLALNSSLEEIKAKAPKLEGVSVHFTRREELDQRIINELKETVQRANGKRVDVNVMIFEFQSKNIREAILQLAESHPNVNFNFVGDAGLETSSKGANNALPLILSEAKKKKLKNIQVKYKVDDGYVLKDRKQKDGSIVKRPVFEHARSTGRFHHKAISVFVDGLPDKLLTGSFNLSDTANKKNYEDLVVVRPVDTATRNLISSFGAEFTAVFNDGGATMQPNEFANFKRDIWERLFKNEGLTPPSYKRLKADVPYDPFQLTPSQTAFDVNGFLPSDLARLEAIVGKDVAKKIMAERKANGRFSDAQELSERVAEVASLNESALATLKSEMSFGNHQVSINSASLEELIGVGFTQADARQVVEHRSQNAEYQSVDDLLTAGISQQTLSRLKRFINAREMDAFFTSKSWQDPASSTGYGPTKDRNVWVVSEDNTLRQEPAKVTAVAVNLFNRSKLGSSIDIAMYGLSPSSAECQALVAAAKRGVKVRLVLDDSPETQRTVDGIRAALGPAFLQNFEIRSSKTITNHHKFAVSGDDAFNGSANFSLSSVAKHSENRVEFLNMPELADAFRSRFEEIWSARGTRLW